MLWKDQIRNKVLILKIFIGPAKGYYMMLNEYASTVYKAELATLKDRQGNLLIFLVYCHSQPT